ncbi:hypothetical protein KL921_004112 [Ogataea angusta]|nr:hypothetical protein KL921_004112 [Ogataea angusta]
MAGHERERLAQLNVGHGRILRGKPHKVHKLRRVFSVGLERAVGVAVEVDQVAQHGRGRVQKTRRGVWAAVRGPDKAVVEDDGAPEHKFALVGVVARLAHVIPQSVRGAHDAEQQRPRGLHLERVHVVLEQQQARLDQLHAVLREKPDARELAVEHAVDLGRAVWVVAGPNEQHAEQLAQCAARERERFEEQVDVVRELVNVQKLLVRAKLGRFGVQPQTLGYEVLRFGLVVEEQRKIEIFLFHGLFTARQLAPGHLNHTISGRDAVVAFRERVSRDGVREPWRADRDVSEGGRVLAGHAAPCAGRACGVDLVAPGFSLFARDARETGYHQVRKIKNKKLIS